MGDNAEYDPRYDVIRVGRNVSENDLKSAVAHEVFHALSKTPDTTDVEEGLVYAMEELHVVGDWTAVGGTVDFKTPHAFTGRVVVYRSVAHAIYRIFQKTDKETALEFALKVDEEQPTDIYDFQAKMKSVGGQMGIRDKVREVLVAMGARDETLLGGTPSNWPGPLYPWEHPDLFRPALPTDDDEEDNDQVRSLPDNIGENRSRKDDGG